MWYQIVILHIIYEILINVNIYFTCNIKWIKNRRNKKVILKKNKARRYIYPKYAQVFIDNNVNKTKN